MPHVLNRMALISAVAALAACASTPRVDIASPVGVDLSGKWQLDAAASGDPRTAFAAAVRAQRAEHHASRAPDERRMGDNGRGGPGAEGSPSGDEFLRPLRDPGEQIGALVPVASELLIDQRPGEVRLTFTGYGTQTLAFGAATNLMLESGTGKRVAGWEDGRFIVRTTLKEGLTIDDRYALAPDGSQLLRDVTMEAPGLKNPIVVRQVFGAVR